VVVLRHASEVAPTFPARVARGLGGLAFAFGALALVYGRLGRPTHDGGLKGNVSWSVVAKRGDRTWTISEGERLRRGDRLAFTCAVADARYFLLLSVDAAGTVALYGTKDCSPLPVSIELDDGRGEERLFGLFSNAPLDAETAKQAVATAVGRARGQNRAVGAADVNISAEVTTIGFKTL
jgi:hypothetical protein